MNDLLILIMSIVREVKGYSGKLGIEDATKLLSATKSKIPLKISGATIDGEWQKFLISSSYVQAASDDYIDIKKGHTMFLKCTLKTDGQFDSTYVSFYQKNVGHHNVVADVKQSSDGTVQISAAYTAETDGSYITFDLNALQIAGASYAEVSDYALFISPVGGVTKALLSALRRHFSSSLIGGVA